MTCHTATTPAGTPTRQAQAERVKRPILSLSGKMLDPEEYEHFVYTFRQFKNRLGDDQDSATLLRECLGTDVSRILYSNSGAALGSFTEEQILTNITKHCVNQQTIQARTTELHRQGKRSTQTRPHVQPRMQFAHVVGLGTMSISASGRESQGSLKV